MLWTAEDAAAARGGHVAGDWQGLDGGSIDTRELQTTVPAARSPAGRTTTRGQRTESKTVTVEVRKKRTYVKRADLLAKEQERQEAEAAERARPRVRWSR